MKIDMRESDKGKTADLIMLSNATNQNILCADEQKRKIILGIAKDLNVKIPKVVTVREVGMVPVMTYTKSFLIDDIEDVMDRWLCKPVDVVTTSCKLLKSNKSGYIQTVAQDIADLVARKNKDYNNSFDKSIDKRGNDVYFIRIEDKLSRLENLLKSNEKAKINESIEDTLKDIVGYTLLMMNYLNNKQV